MSKQLKSFIKNPDEIKKLLERSSVIKLVETYFFKYAKCFFEYEKQYVNNYKITISELLTEQIIDRITNSIDEPFELDEKVVKQIIDQEAVKELFSSLIYAALEKFVKKLPFSGLLGGMNSFEKEIKNFLLNSMNFTIDIATKFVTDKKNEKVIQDSMKKLLNILYSQELDLILNKFEIKSFKDKEEEIFKNLVSHLLETQMIKEGLNYTIDLMYKTESEKTIKELINNPEIEGDSINYICDTLYDVFMDYLKDEIMEKIIEKNICDFYDTVQLS